MRAAIAVFVATALLAATYVAADGFAVCVFQGSEHVNGYFTFQQAESGSDVTVVANFTSTRHFSGLYLHFHTYGDLDLQESKQECWTDVVVGPYSAPQEPHYILDTSWASGFNLFGDNSIVGRRGALYAKESVCATAIVKRPIAECVVGVRNVAAQVETNDAGQYLDADPTSGFVKLAGTTGQFGDNQACTGSAYFVPTSDGQVYVSIHINGLLPHTRHAVHVHAYGDITKSDAMSAGLHLNPYNLVHGYPPNPIRHMGDMGNVTTNGQGVAHLEDTFDIMSLTAKVGNIIGRTLVVHSLGDDGNPTGSVTSTGSAGGRLAKGVIGISSRLPENYEEGHALARIAARKLIAAINPRPPATTSDAPEQPEEADAAPALAEAAPVEADIPLAEVAPTDATATPTTTTDHKVSRKAKRPAAIISA